MKSIILSTLATLAVASTITQGQVSSSAYQAVRQTSHQTSHQTNQNSYTTDPAPSRQSHANPIANHIVEMMNAVSQQKQQRAFDLQRNGPKPGDIIMITTDFGQQVPCEVVEEDIPSHKFPSPQDRVRMFATHVGIQTIALLFAGLIAFLVFKTALYLKNRFSIRKRLVLIEESLLLEKGDSLPSYNEEQGNGLIVDVKPRF